MFNSWMPSQRSPQQLLWTALKSLISAGTEDLEYIFQLLDPTYKKTLCCTSS